MPEETPPTQTIEENRPTYKEIAADESVHPEIQKHAARLASASTGIVELAVDDVDPSNIVPKIPATPEELAGAEFLHSRDSKLHQSQPVSFEQTRQKRLGHESSQKPAVKISDWLRVLERTHMGTGASEARIKAQPQVIERIKDSYHSQYVIKPDNVPESTFELEQRIAKQQGHGDIPITDEFRREKIDQIVSDQEASLDRWVDYLTSDDAIYPTWAKVWAFNEITKMGRLEKKTSFDESGRETESASYSKRDETTTAPFPTINPRALALTIGVMQKKLSQKGLPKSERGSVENASALLNDEQFKQLLSSESFSKLYTQFLIEQPEYSSEGLKETRGVWKKYEQGSEPDELVASIQGHPLEWCTANPETARGQLAGGDFYVYYSIDGDNNPTIPRVAIRMDDDSIAEVRGIAPSQELDPYIYDVVSKKMEEFPDGADFQKKAADMKRLTDIEERSSLGQELSPEDLRFLYQIDEFIMGFGYGEDPRVVEILSQRDVVFDLNSIFEQNPEINGSLSLTIQNTGRDSISPQYKNHSFHFPNYESIKGLNLPKKFGGNLTIEGFTDADGFTLPDSINGNLSLYGLKSADSLMLPQFIGGNLILSDLNDAEGLVLSNIISGNVILSGLTTAKGLEIPTNFIGGLDLSGIETTENLILPQEMHGSLKLSGLTSAVGLNLPQTIDGDLDLSGIKTTENLTLPQEMHGSLKLSGLTSAVSLNLPQTIDGDLDLARLKSSKGLILPRKIGGKLNLFSIVDAEGLVLPETIGSSLDLSRVTNIKGTKLPLFIGGSLSLNYLESADGLILPRIIEGDLYLYGLASLIGLNWPDRIGGNIKLRVPTHIISNFLNDDRNPQHIKDKLRDEYFDFTR